MFFGDKKFLLGGIRDKKLIIDSPETYKKGRQYFYYLRIKLESGKDLRKYPFVIVFDSLSFLKN